MNSNSKLRQRLACLLGICALMLGSITVSQATITVTSLNDGGAGSLRQAIADAALGDTINFAVTGTITLTNEIVIQNNGVTIIGPGAKILTVSGNNSNRVFRLPFTASVASISSLTIANGRTDLSTGDRNGAGINNNGFLTISDCIVTNCNAGIYSGGGIFNSLSLTLSRSAVSDNVAVDGGGIYNSFFGGGLTVSDCTISSNSAADGGGICNRGSAAITNCTISGNRASGNVFGGGGGILSAGTMSLHSSTVCSNFILSSSGGGIHVVSGIVSVRNSMVAGNSAGNGADSSGTINSKDYNLIQNTNGCTITNLTAHNIYNQDPKLGPLTYLGGPTPTHPLRFDSPALDAGNSSGLTTDQRGLPRPIGSPAVAGGDGSDIGAYEADPNLRMTAIAKAGNDILLNFTTVFGRNYQIDGKNNLGGSWTMVTNNIPGSGGVVQAVDAGGAGQSQRFYRATQLP
jgi:hypothetical protein